MIIIKQCQQEALPLSIVYPNLFLVGAKKCGTTSLADALGNHPSIFMSTPKEPNYFDRLGQSNRLPANSLDAYLNIFQAAKGEEVAGEASVSYLDSSAAAQRIRDFNPDSKIVISLRNPLDRIRSLYEMYVRQGLTQSFDHITRVDPWLVRQCFYYEPVKRFVDIFPLEQIHIVNFENLKSDWDAELRKVHIFLAVEPLEVEKPRHRNKGGIPRNRVASILTNRRIVSAAKSLIPEQFHALADKTVKELAFHRCVIPEQQLRRLHPIFSEDVEKLDNLLSENYSNIWFGGGLPPEKWSSLK